MSIEIAPFQSVLLYCMKFVHSIRGTTLLFLSLLMVWLITES